MEATSPDTTDTTAATDTTDTTETGVEEMVIEEVSIDGMCGVY